MYSFILHSRRLGLINESAQDETESSPKALNRHYIQKLIVCEQLDLKEIRKKNHILFKLDKQNFLYVFADYWD